MFTLNSTVFALDALLCQPSDETVLLFTLNCAVRLTAVPPQWGHDQARQASQYVPQLIRAGFGCQRVR